MTTSDDQQSLSDRTDARAIALGFAAIVAAMLPAVLDQTILATALPTMLSVQVVRAGEPGAVERFVANLRVIGPRLLAPSTVAVLALGVWMVLDNAAWDFGQLWVLLALGLFGGAVLIGAAHQSRRRSARSGPSSAATSRRRAASSHAGRGATG